MKSCVAAFFVLLVRFQQPVAALKLNEAAAAVVGSSPPARSYPVSRIVNLLKDMKKQLEKEGDADEEVYEKLACWCETNDKAKTKAITDAEVKLSQLQSTIEKSIALKETLGVEIDGLEKEIAENQRSLDAATALRSKQAAEFTAEEKEMMESIVALEAAITVLAKHHGAAALIENSNGGAATSTAHAAEIRSAASVAAKLLRRHTLVLRGIVTPHQRKVIAAFAQQAQPDYFEAAPTFKQSYQPQGGEIFGILRQMKETFESNLSDSQKDELEAQTSYAALKVAKEAEIATGQTALEDKQQQLANTVEKLAQARDEHEDTTATLTADEKFLMDLKKKCTMTDHEWEERQKTRQSELAAVAQAINILSTDDARELFSRTFNAASFLQTVSHNSQVASHKASKLLQEVAARVHDPKLVALAISARLDPFTQVKQAIDDMVAELLKEAADETKHRDFCIDEMGKNERTTAAKVHEKAKVETNIESLQITIQDLNATITTLKSEIADLKTQRQRAKEDREMEHNEFDGTIADQRETQRLLQEALDVLQSVYKNTKAPSLVQHGVNASYGPPPPKDFNVYEKSQASGGVVSLIMHILEDAKAMEAETLHAEQQAQTSYQEFVQETQRSVEAKEASILGRSTEMSSAEEELLEAKSEFDGLVAELGGLAKDLAGLHGDCDFYLKNFEARTQARDEEVDALRKAKAYLSGMA